MADYSYSIDKRLIVVPVRLSSHIGYFDADFVLDTGASHTIIDYRIAELIGYSRSDSISVSRVSSAVGKEEGYRIKIAVIETLGKRIQNFEVACHALYEQGVEGLLGMTFLERFDFCIFSSRRVLRI
jgi:clan AA aspartic protease (TIGR02281 family)